jgi:hypothetical protein
LGDRAIQGLRGQHGANGGDGLVEGRKDVVGTRGGSDAMAVHVGAEIGGDAAEDDRDVLGR